MFFFNDCSGRAVSWEDNQVVVKRIELLADGFDNLLIVAAGEVGTPNAAIEQCIAAKDAVGFAHQTDATGGMTGCMQDCQRKRTKGKDIALLQKNIWFSMHKRRGTAKHLRSALICVHIDIIWMNRQRHRIDRAHGVNSADMVYVTMRIDDIFGDKVQFLHRFQNTFGLIAGVNNHCLVCFWTRIEVTIFLERADRHTGHNGHMLSRHSVTLLILAIRHLALTPLPALAYVLRYIIP